MGILEAGRATAIGAIEAGTDIGALDAVVVVCDDLDMITLDAGVDR